MIDLRQVMAAFLTFSMFVMLGNMIKRDHIDPLLVTFRIFLPLIWFVFLSSFFFSNCVLNKILFCFWRFSFSRIHVLEMDNERVK